uniref:Uncharacterized protein n=1 Tax=Anguilla anguilla TaxID=7936 RepID=A0A0E9W263_ANGAN
MQLSLTPLRGIRTVQDFSENHLLPLTQTPWPHSVRTTVAHKCAKPICLRFIDIAKNSQVTSKHGVPEAATEVSPCVVKYLWGSSK